MNLTWAYRGSPPLPTLLPHAPWVYCDIAHITNPSSRMTMLENLPQVPPGDGVLALDLEFKPNTGGHFLEPGTYYFHVILAAANARPRRYKIEVIFVGKWFDDEEKMFDVGFKMRCVS